MDQIKFVKSRLFRVYGDASLHTLMTKIVMTDELGRSWTYFDEALHRYYDVRQSEPISDKKIMAFIKAYRSVK